MTRRVPTRCLGDSFARLRRDSRRTASRGFSILEIMVVVAIVGVVAVIGVPSLLNQLSKVRLEAAASDVANLIRQTRLRAIRDNKVYVVEVAGANVNGQTFVGSTETAPFEMEFNNPPIEIYPNTGIADCQDKFDGSGEAWGGTSITYQTTGVAQGTGAICVWDGEENILQVVVEFPAGQPTVRKYLKTGHSPTGAEGFFEKTSAATSGSTWIWY